MNTTGTRKLQEAVSGTAAKKRHASHRRERDDIFFSTTGFAGGGIMPQADGSNKPGLVDLRILRRSSGL
jgi:hypothetical protein